MSDEVNLDQWHESAYGLLKEPATKESTLTLTCLADVEEEAIDWLWYQVLAFGTIAMEEGEPDVGKTIFWCDVAARVSTGRDMPDGSPLKEPRNVIIVAPEDALSYSIKPRLRAAGADMDRIFSVALKRDDQDHLVPLSLPEDLNNISDLIRQKEAGLIIFDPITAFPSSKISSHDNASVRKMLTPLADLLDQTHCAGLLLRHLNQSGDLKAIYRGTGSNAFLEVARSGFAVAIHPDDVELPKDQRRRVVAQTKGNLTRERLSLAFRVSAHPQVTNVAGEPVPRIDWEGAADVDADTLLKGRDARKDQPKRAEAKRLLEELLDDGNNEVRADFAKSQGTKAGLSPSTMDRAANDLGLDKIGVRKEGRDKGAYEYWLWRRPPRAAMVIPLRKFREAGEEQ